MDTSPVPRGRITLQPHDELQVALGDQPLVFALRGGDSSSGAPCGGDVFGQPLMVEHTYIVIPHSLFTLNTFTGVEIDLLGTPAFAGVTKDNKSLHCQLLNLSTSLNKIRTQAFGRKHWRGPSVMVVGAPRSGKTSMITTLARHAERSGWRPTLFHLDPSGRSNGVNALLRVPGMILGQIPDRLDEPAVLEALLKRCEAAIPADRLDILREWGLKISSDVDMGTRGASKRKRAGSNINAFEARTRVLGLLGNLARKEAMGLVADGSRGGVFMDSLDEQQKPQCREKPPSLSAADDASMFPATPFALCEWERFLRPILLNYTREELNRTVSEDSIGIWTGVLKVSCSAEEALLICATETLENAINIRFNSDREAPQTILSQASGKLIDCPAGLSPEAINKLVELLGVDLLICVGDPKLHGMLDISTAPCCVAALPKFRTDCPDEIFQKVGITEATRWQSAIDVFALPRISLACPEEFARECTGGLDSPVKCLRGISIPLPARLLFTPVAQTLSVPITILSELLVFVELKLIAQSMVDVTPVTNIPWATWLVHPQPAALLRIPAVAIKAAGLELNRAVLATSVSSPCVITRTRSESSGDVTINVRQRDAQVLKAGRSVVICIVPPVERTPD